MGEGGEAILFSAGFLSGEVIVELSLDTGFGTVDECAVAVTDNDDLWLPSAVETRSRWASSAGTEARWGEAG